MGVEKLRILRRFTPTLRPQRAEQVPSALADGCDPAAGCSAAI